MYSNFTLRVRSVFNQVSDRWFSKNLQYTPDCDTALDIIKIALSY